MPRTSTDALADQPPTDDHRPDDSPVVVWRFVDGRPGHEKQSAGLLQGLEALCPTAVYDIDVRFKAMLWRQVARHLLGTNPDLPAPHLLIGVGHRTHLPLLIARITCGGRSVVLMKPTLPRRLFDLLFVPEHDRGRRGANVVATRGVVCPVVDAAKVPGSGLILLGGTSPHFEWSNTHIGEQVGAIARATPEIRWQVCDSRRTPHGLRECIPNEPNLTYCHWQSLAGDFLETTLPRTEYVWVSADSASMLYESLSAGAWVGVIALKPMRKRGNKHASSLAKLIAEGQVASTRDGYRLDGSGKGPSFAPENRRCAKIVVDRLLSK